MQTEKIKQSVLFTDLSEEDFQYALKYFEAKEVDVKKSEILHCGPKVLDFFGLVLDGRIEVSILDAMGNKIVMAHNTPGKIFGDSLCFLKKENGLIIEALTDSKILKLSTKNLSKVPKNELDGKLQMRFMKNLAERTLDMNGRIQILSSNSARERVILLLSQFGAKNGKEFVIPYDRDDMASYLGLNRSALSRELSRMKEDGIIEYKKNVFRLL